MKKNKIASLMLASAIAMAAVVPSFAAGFPGLEVTEEEQPDINVTINLTKPANITVNGTGKVYTGYRLLNLTTSLKAGHEDHSGAHDPDCYNYAYTVPDAYRNALLQALDLGSYEDDDAIIATIEALAEDPDAVRAFADAAYAAVRDMNPDETASNKTFSNVAQGYWLIVEQQKEADPDTYSLVMLDTAGQDEITITSKEDSPTLAKYVYEETPAVAGDSGTSGGVGIDPGFEGDFNIQFAIGNSGAGSWGTAADYDVGDDVPFKLVGTLPNNFSNYKSYKYTFHDSLGSGLVLNVASVTVLVDFGNDDYYELQPSDYTLRTTDVPDDCSFGIEIPDLRALVLDGGRTVKATDNIVVMYTARLTDAADLGNPGNTNEAHLEFSSNPNAGGEGDTAHTPKDKVAVFSYQVVVNKVDKAGQPLAGANFKLMVEKNGVYVDYMENEMTDGQTTFTFSGLDSGKYRLVETEVPDGYNKADDVDFEIIAELDDGSDDPSLLSLVIKDKEGNSLSDVSEDAVFTISLADGSATTQVVNTTGIRLPSTGGAGAYAIYGGGAALIAGGIALAVVKKKKNSNNAD